MSSQSTLVRREEHDDLDRSYGIMDMIEPEFGRGQLTESRINAHMQLEARKHGGGYRRGEREEYEEGDIFVEDKPPRRRRRDQRMGQLVVTPEQEGGWSLIYQYVLCVVTMSLCIVRMDLHNVAITLS